MWVIALIHFSAVKWPLAIDVQKQCWKLSFIPLDFPVRLFNRLMGVFLEMKRADSSTFNAGVFNSIGKSACNTLRFTSLISLCEAEHQIFSTKPRLARTCLRCSASLVLHAVN